MAPSRLSDLNDLDDLDLEAFDAARERDALAAKRPARPTERRPSLTATEPAYDALDDTSDDEEGLPAPEETQGDLSAPRIAIHVFCRSNDLMASIQKAMGDRRLQRATPKLLPGGIGEAASIYREQPTPPLIIVESTEKPAQLLAMLEDLAEVCDPSTKVVIIGRQNDIALYRELIRRGVSEYLVAPLTPLQIIRAVTSLYSDPDTAFVGRAISFVGVKGGVGSSTLAHNVAFALSESTKLNTVIVDYDLAFGTAGLDFNQDALQGLRDALAQPDRLDAVLLDRLITKCTDHLSLFAAPANVDEVYDIDPEAYEQVFSQIRGAAPYLILDLPHHWSGWMRQTLLASDEIVMVATPDLASLRNAKNMNDLLARLRPNDAPIRLILNQTGVQGRPEIPLREFARALEIDPSLVVPFDPKLFGDAANNGQMVMELNPKSKISEGLVQFANMLARRTTGAPPPPAGAQSLFARLLARR